MRTTCDLCGGGLTLSREKLGMVVGGGAVVAGAAALFGLSGGFIPLAVAAFGGSSVAAQLLRVKCQLAAHSMAHPTIVCSVCGRPASAASVLGL